jgi:hypothetical protein
MESIKLIARNGEAVRGAIEMGEIIHLDTASEEITDEFLLFAIESGLLEKWGTTFPDPRKEAEIDMKVLLATSLAARFAGIYSMRKSGYVLRSARVLGELGYSVEVTQEGKGISRRGTSEGQIISGDVLRKILVKMENEVEVTLQMKAIERGDTRVGRVRERGSRRAVKKELDEQEAQARGRAAANKIIDWYRESVGRSMLEYAELGDKRRLHILDCTRIETALESGHYECAGVVKNDDGTLSRGYKLATLRTMLDTAGLFTELSAASIETHDLEASRQILLYSPALRCGDLLLEDRGFLDGETISLLKTNRQVDVIVPLRSNMAAFDEAVRLAELAGRWHKHPSRREQQIALVKAVDYVWDSCSVALNACVIRFWDAKQSRYGYIVLVTTDLTLSAKWIVLHYQQRPEIEQDYEQMKSGGWKLEKLSTTRYSEIVFYLTTVLLSYSLYHLFSNTQAGARFAKKTRQAVELEQLRTHRTHVIVYAGGYFEIFETLTFVHIVLQMSSFAQDRLRIWLDQHLNRVQKRE